MKPLNEFIEERLIINKNFNDDNEINDVIDKLFDNVEHDDIMYDYDLDYEWVIKDVIQCEMSGYSSIQQKKMIDKIIYNTQYFPRKVYKIDYDRGLRKTDVDAQSDYVRDVIKLHDLITTSKFYNTKTINLIDNNVFKVCTDDYHIVMFLMNTDTYEIFSVVIIETKN